MAPLTRGRKRQITTTATSPQTPGGGKGKGQKRQTTTKETTTTSPQTPGGGGTPTKNENSHWTIGQFSDDEDYHRPARETVLAECRKKKEEAKKESKRGLKSLITYLEKMGMPAEQTFEQAIRQLGEVRCDRAKKDQISKRISKYILLRLLNTTRIIVILLSVLDWDHEVVSLISESLKDFKEDLPEPVRVPELEDIARDAAYVLEADKEGQVRMGNTMKDCLFLWTWHSSHGDTLMKEWAKYSTRTIVTGFEFGCPSLG